MEAKGVRQEKLKKKKLKERKLTELEGRETPRETPPHLLGNGPRRGRGSDSSSNDSEAEDSHFRKGRPEPPSPPPPAPVSSGPGGRAEDELFLDEEDDMGLRVSRARRAKSIVDKEGDEEEGLGEGDEVRSSGPSAWTTSSKTRTNYSDVSQSSPASDTGCQRLQKARTAAAATFRTATSSTLGDGSTRDDNVLAGDKASPMVGQRQPAPSSNRQGLAHAREDVIACSAEPQSPPLGQRQPAWRAEARILNLRRHNDQRAHQGDVVRVAGDAQQQQPPPGPGQHPPDEWDRRSSATPCVARSRNERSTPGRSGND
ncbi:hypothetical protein BJV74DRAFT_138754 [Russula compacta]|nr:hypothetical protein BJV74DRAFT_138754 [Russula compacta]